MNRYSKYFLQHSLWLDDGFCQYYVQDDTWGRQEILDVESVIFDWTDDADQWIARCRAYDQFTTLRRLRTFLADHCREPFHLHRMTDRQVMRAAARQISRCAHPVVINPRMGWAVQVDEHCAAPVLPISVESEPELAGLTADLKVALDALVAEQQKKYAQYEAQLAKLSPEQKALLYSQKAGGAVYDSTIGDAGQMLKAAPGTIWKAAKAFPGFYAGYLKVLWKVAQLPSQMAALTGHAIATGDYNPLKTEIDQIVTPVAQTYEQALKYKSMLTLLFGDHETYTLLHDFAQRYWAATHPIERTQMAASAVSDIVVTVILAIVTAGIGAAANVASKSGKLVKVAKLLEKIAMTIKKISPESKLIDKAKDAAGKVRKTEKRAAKAARELKHAEAEVKTARRAEKLEKEAQKEYDAAKKIDGPKTTTQPKDFKARTNSEGLTTRAEGRMTGPHPKRKKGYRPEPVGGRAEGHHRGHLVPENMVDDPKIVNVKENIISESPGSNLGPKRVFENKAGKIAKENPNSVVETVHFPKYKNGETVPHAVTHYIKVDGKIVHGVSIPNK